MGRKTISINDSIESIILTAAQMWPESAHNQSMLIAKIMADWDRIRANGGGKNQQVISRLDRHEVLLMMICRRLGIAAQPEENGDHHGQS